MKLTKFPCYFFADRVQDSSIQSTTIYRFLGLTVIAFALAACSDADKAADARQGVKANSGQGNLSKESSPAVKPSVIAVEPPKTQIPTRSELRVLTEQTKATEADTRHLIELFDANLDNRAVRAQTQSEFNKMLPAYKEKMLKIAKAKLKEAHDN